MKSLNNSLRQGFGWSSMFSQKFPSRSGEFQHGPKVMDSFSCRPSVSRAFHYKLHKRLSNGRVSKK